MSDAPERIWAYTQSGTNVRIWRSDNARPVSTEYRRADLPPTREQIVADPRVMALVEALDATRNDFLKWSKIRGGMGTYKAAVDRIDTALAALEAPASLTITDNEGETE